jgi:hypothetical protein
MDNTQKIRQFIALFGSGQPGEKGTDAAELHLLSLLENNHLRFGYIPFHILSDGPENDYYKLSAILKKAGFHPPLLIEFEQIKSPEELAALIDGLDIIVLGSGFCEPYLNLIFYMKLDKVLRSFLDSGGSFIGYSAGSIALSEYYVHVVFFSDLFKNFVYISEQNDSPEQSGQYLQALFAMLPQSCREESEQIMQDLLMGKWPNSPLMNEIFEVFRIPALGFVPGVSVLPHFHEAPYSTIRHIEYAAKTYNDIKHFGLPNGVCLLNSFQKGRLRNSELLGQNPVRSIKPVFFDRGERKKLPIANAKNRTVDSLHNF